MIHIEYKGHEKGVDKYRCHPTGRSSIPDPIACQAIPYEESWISIKKDAVAMKSLLVFKNIILNIKQGYKSN